MIVAMAISRKARKEAFATLEWAYITGRMAAQLGHADLREVREAIIDIKLATSYGTLVNAFKPGFFVSTQAVRCCL